MWVADYQTTCDLYFRALDGDTDAANKLNGRAFVATGFMFFDFATGGFNGSRSAGPDDIPTPDGRKTNLVNKGYTDDVVDDIFNMKNADLCSDELLESIAKSGKSADVINTLSKYSDDVIETLNKSADKDVVVSLIAKYGDEAVSVSAKGSSDTLKAIANLSEETAESFFKTAGKNCDELISAINKSSNIDEAISFVSKYADDGAEIFLRHGDDAIAAVKGCDAPYKAIQIIKNGGLQYGEQAVQAIKKSGNKAVEALTKVPTKECAELIATHGDIATRLALEGGEKTIKAVSKLSDDATNSFFSTVGKQNVEFFVTLENCNFTDDAVEMIAKFEDNGVEIFNKYKDKNVKGLSTALNSKNSNAITFALDENGNVFVAGSCNYKNNPTITVPEGYLKPDQASSYYVEQYNKLLTDDGIQIMNKPDEIVEELKKLNKAVDATRAEANRLKLYEYQRKGCALEYTLAAGHSITNCGEIWSAREAILNGARFDKLSFNTYCNGNIGNKKLGEWMEKCNNCQFTFAN